MIVSACLDKNICKVVQHGKTSDRLLYISVVVNAGEREGNGNRNQMPSVPILINFGFPLKILIRNW